MAYCTNQDVRDVMQLDADDDPANDVIDRLITLADGEVDGKLGSQTAPVSTLVKSLSAHTTAVMIVTPGPHSVAIGNVRADAYAIAQWEKKIKELYRLRGFVGEVSGPRVVAWDDR